MHSYRDRARDFFVSLAQIMVKPLAVAATAGMWIVLIMGATVTNTGSQTGCGPSWPLCRGQFIPQMALSTAIEFSHRAVVGVESTLVIAFAIAAWLTYGQQLTVRILSVTMVLFLFVQAGLGAWAVMSPQNAAVLALHFGVSLIAFASVLLVALMVFENGYTRQLSGRPLPPKFGAFVWTVTLFSYVVVYLGAYVRHRGASQACSGWPLCNGRVVPVMTGLTGTAFAHRLAALVLVIGVSALVTWAYQFHESRPDIFLAARVSVTLVLLQAASGAFVEATHLDLFSALLHAGLVALLFGTLAYLCLQVVRVPNAVRTASMARTSPELAR